MRSILKSFTRPKAKEYEFPDIFELIEQEPEPELEPEPIAEELEEAIEEEEEEAPSSAPIEFAQVQAEAILADARREAEAIKESARLDAQIEIEEMRCKAHDEGFRAGYAEGLDKAAVEAKLQQEELAAKMEQEVKEFLEDAVRERDSLMDEVIGELKELAITVAEKIVRVSLKSSSEVISRMILAATEKLKRREWVHIYIAGCDAKGMAQASPALSAALAAVSNHVKIVPMADDESGTCIIEMPDEIIDASASTQFSNIRDIMADIPLSRDIR